MDLLDKKIICELDMNCRTPLSRLAKKLRVSRNAVAYRIRNLEQTGVIRRYICSVDLGKLGYKSYKIYFKLRNTSEAGGFAEALAGNRQTVQVIKTEGGFDYSCAIAVRSVVELDSFLTELKSRFKNAIKDYTVSIIVYSRIFKFEKIFLNRAQQPLRFLKYSGEEKEAAIDDADRALLRELAVNARMPLVGLAGKTGLSLDVVKYRIKKLGSEVINSFRIEIDLSKLGWLHYAVLLRTVQATALDEKRLVAWCALANNVLYCTKRIGQFDFEISFSITGIAHLNGFLSELKAQFGGMIDSYELVLNSRALKLNYVPF